MSVYEIEAKWELDIDQYIKLHDFFVKCGAARTSGTDIFCINKLDPSQNPMRLRIRPDGTGFVTIKKMVKNYIRRENELKLSSKNVAEEVLAVVDDLGYTPFLKIHKSGVNLEVKIGSSDFHIALYAALSGDKVKYFLELELDKGIVDHKNPENSANTLETSLWSFFNVTLKKMIQEEDIKLCDKMLWQYFTRN